MNKPNKQEYDRIVSALYFNDMGMAINVAMLKADPDCAYNRAWRVSAHTQAMNHIENTWHNVFDNTKGNASEALQYAAIAWHFMQYGIDPIHIDELSVFDRNRIYRLYKEAENIVKKYPPEQRQTISQHGFEDLFFKIMTGREDII